MEDPQEMGYISVDRYYPVMSKIIMQQKLVQYFWYKLIITIYAF